MPINMIQRLIIMTIATIMMFSSLFNSARADCTLGACLGVGPELLSIDSNDGPVLNLLTQLLLESSVAVNVGNWEGMAQTDINLLSLLNAVAVEASVGSVTEALSANISLLDLLSAATTALQNDGDVAGAAVVTAFRSSVVALPGINNTIQLEDLFTISDERDPFLDLEINALHLIIGSLQLFNYEHTVGTPDVITVSNASLLSSLGLNTLASSVEVSLYITEPPQFKCGPLGTVVQSANTRLKLSLSLLNGFGITDNSLGTAIEVTLTQLDLYIEVAPGTATLTAITPASASTGTVTATATHGIANVYLGAFNDSDFFDKTFTIPSGASVYDELAVAEVGAVSILGSDGSVSLRTYAEGTQSSSGLTFTTFTSTQTKDSSAAVIASLLTEGVTHLQLSIDGGGLLGVLGIIGITLADLTTLITAPLANEVLNNLVSPILTNTVDTLLGMIGASIGKVVVWVGGFGGACEVSGTLYHDRDSDSVIDVGEDWSDGDPVWVHIVSGGQSVSSAQVLPGTGSYALTNIPLGSYSLVVSDEAGAITASAPEGWSFVTPANGTRSLDLLSVVVGDQHFGLIHVIVTVSGRIFNDTGTGGGTANDGVYNGSEAYRSQQPLAIYDASNDALIALTESDSSGQFQFEIASSWMNNGVYLSLADTDNVLVIAIQTGDSGGSYSGITEQMSFTPVTQTITGVDIAVVPMSQLESSQEVIASGGQALAIAHQFTAGSAGSLTVNLSQRSSREGWSASLVLDSDCDGVIDTNESQVSGSIALNSSDLACLISNIFTGAAEKEGSQAVWRLSASYQLNGSITESLFNDDLISIANLYRGRLLLVKSVDKTTALPGDTLVYTILYKNQGAEPINNLIIYDFTPDFTTYQSSNCAASLGAGLTGCTVNAPAVNASGEIAWQFTGTLRSQATGSLSFDVLIDQ